MDGEQDGDNVSSNRGRSDPPTVGDYIRVIRRRAWVVAALVGLGLCVGLYYDSASTPLYQASSQVLLSRDSPAAVLTGTSGLNDKGDPERFIQTQVRVAGTESLAARVLTAARLPDRKPSDLVAATQVTGSAGADVLQFTVRDTRASLAARLARIYGVQFASYQRQLDTESLNGALAAIDQKIALARENTDQPGLYQALVAKKRQLETLVPLETGKAQLLTVSPQATKIRPVPARDVMVALAAGLLLGVALAFVVEALDRRVDSLRGVGDWLGLPLLGRIPSERWPYRPEHLTVVAGRDGAQAEAYQILRARLESALELGGLDKSGSAVMVTSARREDGKSTTVGNLGVALALARRRVILVDLDRRGSLERVFGVPHQGPGLIDVALDRVSLDDALVPLAAGGSNLALLSLGGPDTELDELLATESLSDLLLELRLRADLVLVDAPPLLSGAGAFQIANIVDALALVVRVDGIRERVLRRLRSELGRCGQVSLGFVATGGAGDVFEDEPVARLVRVDGSALGTEEVNGSPPVRFDDAAQRRSGVRKGKP
jgi:non-specific protein-tyrosine kinase